ncbi:MAG: M48 family metallopeptidase [Candidatus Manganitrophus sp. SB1]|nr:M48 family metallopeptidase [Candidatus Manganitrophus morganii]
MSSSTSQTELFEVLCFGPGIPPQGERISIRITSEGVILRPGGPDEETLLFESLRITAGGFDHNQITLTWMKREESGSLILSDPRAKTAFLAAAPSFLAPQLRQWQKQTSRVGRGMRFGWFLLGLLILSPLLLGLALWWKSDAIAEWAVHRISHTSEVKFGDLIYAQTRPGLTLLPEGETTKMIEEIGSRLTQASPYPFQWHVADDPTINAFAIPGGHVVVFTGLIEAAESPEEVAGILAHEAEHVLQRHSLKGMVHQLGWRVVLALLLGDIGGGRFGQAAAQMQILSFGRDQESEADLKGLALLKEAKIDPKGMITFFDRLSKKEGASIALLSTHPASANRAEAIRTEIDRIAPWKSEPLPYDWDAIKNGLKK